MPSQKASKRKRQTARTPPPPVRGSKARTGRPSTRVLVIAGIVVVAIIVAIVLAVVLTSNSNSGSNSSASKLPDSSEVSQLLSGIPQNGQVLGKPNAPVTMIQYVDLQCPFCRQFETSSMPTLIKNYVRPGKLKIDSRVVAIIGPDSQRGRQAALAAAQQNKMFNFAQLLYDNQGTENTGWLNDAMIKSAAASIPGLDAAKLQSDKGSSAVSDKLATIDSQAKAAGLQGTPTIFIVHKGGKPQLINLSSMTDPSPIESAINTG